MRKNMTRLFDRPSILCAVIVVAGLIGCSKSGSDSDSADKAAGVSSASAKSLCLEGAYRDGTHCASMDSAALKQVCDVMTHGSGSCAGLPNSDFENTCKAGLYGTDSCSGISDGNLKQACLAAAYGTTKFCDDIH